MDIVRSKDAQIPRGLLLQWDAAAGGPLILDRRSIKK